MLESTSALPNIWLLKLMSLFRSRLRIAQFGVRR